MAAVEALAAAEVTLRGRLIAAFGAGGMPTNARAGERRRHTGHGVGASFLLERGVWADAAVIAKSGWAVSWEEVGLAWIDVEVGGIHTYVGARHRLPYRNPIVDAGRVAAHLEAWFPTYSARHACGLDRAAGHRRRRRGRLVADGGRRAGERPAARRPAPRPRPVAARRPGASSTPRSTTCARRRPDRRAHPPRRRRPRQPHPARALDHHDDDRRVGGASPGPRTSPITATSGATDANILRNRGIPTVRVGLPRSTDDGRELDFAEGMNTVDVDALEQLTRLLVTTVVRRHGSRSRRSSPVAEVVVGVGASHTTLMNTKWAEVDHLARAHDYRNALGTRRERSWRRPTPTWRWWSGSNHFRGFWLDLMPTFTLGVGEVLAAGEHGTPEGPQADRSRARPAVLAGLVAAEFDVAFSARLQVDHGITHAIQYVLPAGLPVVPLVVNCFAPPLPSLRALRRPR